MDGRPVEAPSLLALFFYGTLKRGQINHDRFCRGYARAAQATVRGRLYDLPFGFPALVVPREDVRATGTTNPLADASAQRRLANDAEHPKTGPRVSDELLVFDDFEERLLVLDRFEGFDPESGKPVIGPPPGEAFRPRSPKRPLRLPPRGRCGGGPWCDRPPRRSRSPRSRG